MTVKLYRVGGSVRDELLGVKSKDVDYAVEAVSYEEMRDYFLKNGTVYLEKPEFLTIRGKLNDVDADFVLCRKDGHYTDGRRPDSVSPGTILDDLKRRDFTVNAIAVDVEGNYIDPHNGRDDLLIHRVIRCVGLAEERFSEDSLRLLRAVRFSLTKGLKLSRTVEECLYDKDIVGLLSNVSVERIREELLKCFDYDTPGTLRLLYKYQLLSNIIFSMPIKLKPTITKL